MEEAQAQPESNGPRFAVLLTGHASPFCMSKYGGYGNMMLNLLKDDPSETWDVFPLVDGFRPSLQQLDTYKGFVITGSEHDAHGDEPWILNLCDILRYLHARQKKLLGICFGHQILSRALGGRTGRAEVGWQVGEREIQLCLDAFSKRSFARDLPEKLRVIESHQDQVLELPPDSELLGFSEKTPHEVFGLGNHILGIQGHPEFDAAVIIDLIESRAAKGILSEEVANYSKSTVTQEYPNQKQWQKLCKDFLRD